jgi:hypothetical protein
MSTGNGLTLLDSVRVGHEAGTKGDPIARNVAINGKPFVLGRDASRYVREFAVNHAALIDELAEFALAPFDRMSVSCAFGLDTGLIETLHLWDEGDYRLVIRQGEKCGAIPGWNRIDEGHVNNTALGHFPDEAEALDKLNIDRRVLLAVFLLLGQPSTYRIVDQAAPRSTFRKGKIIRFMASSEIVLNLTKSTALRAMYRAQHRERLAARRHEVRRHWWHFGGDKGCEHDWQPDAIQPRRYSCSCGRIRRERGPFERGDAGRGFLLQSYKVEHGHNA